MKKLIGRKQEMSLTPLVVAQITQRTIDQRGSVNTQIGTSGNDSFNVDHPGDSVSDGSSADKDTVTASVSYTLPVNVEREMSPTPLVVVAKDGNEVASNDTWRIAA